MKYEYKTEVVTSLFGKEKIDRDEWQKVLNHSGAQGWELVNYTLNANVKGEKDGHMLVFKRAVQ